MLIVHPPDDGVISGKVELPPSKSHANRLLALQLLHDNNLQLTNAGESDDVRIMQLAVDHPESSIVDVGHAGTAMRFLTACFSVLEGERIITGSKRMKERPIAPLVNALRSLGAEIDYVEKDGFPPLRITSGGLAGSEVTIRGDISSQYISALMLIGTVLPDGLRIQLEGTVLSFPYIEMTAATINQIGGVVEINKEQVTVRKGIEPDRTVSIEKDWSAAAFLLESAALSKDCDVLLEGLSGTSLQGDKRALELWEMFGLKVTEEDGGVRIRKNGTVSIPDSVDFLNHPDLAQPFAATIAGLGRSCRLTGLDNLRIKETDRIEALIKELTKAGTVCRSEGNDLILPPGQLNGEFTFDTYSDHRMAMSLAPLSLKLGTVKINDPEVVSKSYPRFWNALEVIGFNLE